MDNRRQQARIFIKYPYIRIFVLDYYDNLNNKAIMMGAILYDSYYYMALKRQGTSLQKIELQENELNLTLILIITGDMESDRIFIPKNKRNVLDFC